MRDEMEGRLWTAHHDTFADGIDEAGRRIRDDLKAAADTFRRVPMPVRMMIAILGLSLASLASQAEVPPLPRHAVTASIAAA